MLLPCRRGIQRKRRALVLLTPKQEGLFLTLYDHSLCHLDCSFELGIPAQHFQANRPGRSPAVSAKLLDAAPPPPSASASISAQRAALSAKPARACCGVQCARLSCGGTFRCGAASLTHLERTLCMWVKIAAMVRTLPGGLAGGFAGSFAFQAAGSRCSIRFWFMRSLAAKIRAAAQSS